MKVKSKRILIVIISFLLTASLWILFNIKLYKEINIDSESLLLETNLRDFKISDNFITSISYDPMIFVYFNMPQYVKCVEVGIEEISEDNVTATIFADGKVWSSESLILSKGENRVTYSLAWDEKSYIRLDLAEKPDISLKVGDVKINDKAQIIHIALKEVLAVWGCILILFISALVISSSIQEKYHVLLKQEENLLSKLIGNEMLIKGIRLVIKCWLVYLVSILAIIRADFRYIDDLGRTYEGVYWDWDILSRYLAKLLCKLMGASQIISDTSPLTQIVTLLMMAISVTILIWALVPEKMDSNWIIIAAIPFAISPYFMECISYKIECVMHGASVLLSILPILLYKKRNIIYTCIVMISVIFMCITYQGASGIFPMAIVMIAFVEWHNGENVKKIWKLLYTSIVGYGAGLIFYKIAIMKPVDMHVSSEMLPLNELFSGSIKNLLTYYVTIVSDFKTVWLWIILCIVLLYILIFSITAKRKPLYAFLMAILSIFLLCALSYGIYPVLKECVYLPRTMYEICIALSMICIFVIAQRAFFGKVAVLAIAWCFITFASNYGNCLALQQEFTNMRLQSVVDYLNENYNEEEQYVLEIDGNIGFAPSIQKELNANKLLSKLIPATFGGGWMWSEYRLYNYCGLPSNYKVVWAGDRNNSDLDLLQKDIPLLKICMWFNVYSDGNNILIYLKN